MRIAGIFLALMLAQPMAAGEAQDQVLRLINAQRAAAGCPALVINPALSQAAQSFANAMATQNFFSHTGKDGSKLRSRAQAVGYGARKMAENIAAGQKTPASVVQTWMSSAGHRRNILTCAMRETGIGMAYQPDDAPLPGKSYPMRYYWVQMFGTQ